MRKRFRVPLFAALVGAVVAPVGFALSLESSSTAPLTSAVTATPPPISATSIVMSQSSHERFLPDAAKLLIVGATLFAVAAFVRKAI
jgi:hypothetical protein